MDKVNQSMFATAVVEGRVIPNGVDFSVFQLADRHAMRAALSLPLNARILLFTAHGIRPNIWKDYETMKAATALVAEQLPGQDVRFIGLGEDAPAEQAGPAEIHFVPHQEDPHLVARYYQAADIYLHAARADTFPNTILEALACGTPVVATAVGGIPEQVKSLAGPLESMDYKTYGLDQATGFLVPPKNAKAMAEATVSLLNDERLYQRLADNAARDARTRFAMDRQVEDYLEFYEVMLSRS